APALHPATASLRPPPEEPGFAWRRQASRRARAAAEFAAMVRDASLRDAPHHEAVRRRALPLPRLQHRLERDPRPPSGAAAEARIGLVHAARDVTLRRQLAQ